MENKEEIKVSGLLSEEVMKEYLVFHSRKSRIWYVIFGMLLYAVLIRIAIPDIPIIFMLFAMLFAGMIVWFIVPMATKKKAIKEFRSDQLMQQEVFYIVSRDGISQKVRKSEMLTRWEDILSINETKNLFIFYISKNKAIVIPHKFLVKNEMQLLRQLIKENENSHSSQSIYSEPIARKQTGNPEDLTFTIFISEKMFLAYINFLARKIIMLFPFGFIAIYLFLTLVLFEYKMSIFIAVFAVVVGLATWYFLTTYLNWKATAEYRSDRRLHNDIHLELNADGIIQTLPNSQAHYAWEEILSIYETKNAFLFFVSKNRAIILPQKYVNETEKTEVRNKIKKHAKTKKR